MIIYRLLRPYGIFPVVNDQGERRYIQVEPFLWATGTKFAFYYTYALPAMAQTLRTCKNERAYWVGGSRFEVMPSKKIFYIEPNFLAEYERKCANFNAKILLIINKILKFLHLPIIEQST